MKKVVNVLLKGLYEDSCMTQKILHVQNCFTHLCMDLAFVIMNVHPDL